MFEFDKNLFIKFLTFMYLLRYLRIPISNELNSRVIGTLKSGGKCTRKKILVNNFTTNLVSIFNGNLFVYFVRFDFDFVSK